MPNIATAPGAELVPLGRGEQPERERERLRRISREPVRLPAPDSPDQKMRRADDHQRPVPTIIIDKSALFRAGLVHTLTGTRFRVVADCPSLGELPPKALTQRQTLLLLGLDKETDAVLAQVPLLAERHRGLQVIVLSERFSPEEALSAITSAGSSYLIKDEISPEVLLKSLELASLGSVVVSRGFADGIVNSRAAVADEAVAPKEAVAESEGLWSLEPPQRAAALSSRERVILSRLMRGASNKHIARDLGIAEATVKVHVKSLLRKVRVRNRTQAAMWGINNFGPALTDQIDEQPNLLEADGRRIEPRPVESAIRELRD